MLKSFAVLFLTLCVGFCNAEIKPFTFVHFSDAHLGAPGNVHQLKLALADVDKNFPDASFIIITGDVTEAGFTEQFTTLTQILKTSKRPVYTTMGNHDVRWSNSGKENYRNTFGDTYKTFDFNGVRFVLMDSSMLIEHYGHFDGQQLKRLKGDLESMDDGMFAILGMHHPPLSHGHFIDNEYQFADLISHYNVPLVCDGHGHTLQRYSRNGITYAMGGSVSNSGGPKHSYRVYHVKPDEMISLTRVYDKDITKTEDPVPTNNREHGDLEADMTSQQVFSIKFNGSPYSGPGGIVLDQKSSGSLSISNGNLDLSDMELNNGIHQMTVEVPDDKTTDTSTVQFETSDDPKTTISRRFKLDSGNQSHPAVKDDVLYVGANDGFMRAYDLADPQGNLLWKKNLNREILSAPAVTEDSVIVGSMDTNVYSLNRKTGEVQWKFKTGQAVLAGPLIADDTVYIGSGDYNMYALDLKTGDKKWSFAAQKLIKCTPALANGHLFFGAWDNFFYSVDAKTGELVWRIPVSTMANGHFSEATCNPVISGNNIIFCSHDYSVRCINQDTGSTVWVYKPGKDELGPSYSTALIEKGVAYFGSINGHIVGHDVETGEKVFDVDVRPEKKDDLFDSLPRMKNGRIYIGSVGGNLYCVNIAKKAVEWSVALQPGFIFSGPALWENRVLVGSLNDMVYEITYRE